MIEAVPPEATVTVDAGAHFLAVMPLWPVDRPFGLLISNGFEYMPSGRYWISFFPGVALLLTIVSINPVGDKKWRSSSTLLWCNTSRGMRLARLRLTRRLGDKSPGMRSE